MRRYSVTDDGQYRIKVAEYGHPWGPPASSRRYLTRDRLVDPVAGDFQYSAWREMVISLEEDCVREVRRLTEDEAAALLSQAANAERD